MAAFINADDGNAGRAEMEAGVTGWPLHQKCIQQSSKSTKQMAV